MTLKSVKPLVFCRLGPIRVYIPRLGKGVGALEDSPEFSQGRVHFLPLPVCPGPTRSPCLLDDATAADAGGVRQQGARPPCKAHFPPGPRPAVAAIVPHMAGELQTVRLRRNHRMPVCCRVMRAAVAPDAGDVILGEPPSGQGASLTVRYVLPRPV